MERRTFLGLLGGAFGLLAAGKEVEANEAIRELKTEVVNSFNAEEFLKLCEQAHCKLSAFQREGDLWSPENSGYLLNLRAIYFFSIAGGGRSELLKTDCPHDKQGFKYTEESNRVKLLKCKNYEEMHSLVFNPLLSTALESKKMVEKYGLPSAWNV